MAKPSFISSSEPHEPHPHEGERHRWEFEPHLPRRRPTAIWIALAIIVAVEAFFRLAPPDWVIPNHADEIEYYTSRDVIDAFGAADVAIVGSSRAKESLVMPELRDALRQRFGQDLSVANYATAGARADETHALVEHLLSRGRPRMLLYGITPRDLLGNEPRYARSAIYWSLGDWRQAFREDAGGALLVLPVVVRGAIGEWYYTLRYRQRPLALIEDFWRAVKLQRDGIARFTPFEILRGDVSPNPARGEWTRAQVYDTRRSLVTHPVSDAHVQLYVNGLLENGRYPLGERRVRELRATLQAARRAGVRVVLFETPISALLHRHKPAGMYPEFLAIVRRVAREEDVPFYTESELGLRLTEQDFLEQSHLNRRGAEQLTRALVERVVLPAIGGTTSRPGTHRERSALRRGGHARGGVPERILWASTK